jgi:CRISPR-associated protein Csm3
MKQLSIKTIKGKIVVKTGLHIGAGNDKVEIGGMDNPIIRNPRTREPYIPGSSIKGKMRSLMEWKLDKIAKDDKNYGKPCSCGKAECQICRVFGSANNSKPNEDQKGRGPTRLIVRDATLTKEWSDMFNEGKAIIEEKAENSLNRITAEANPRPIERVVPGVTFDFEIAYRIIDTGDEGKTDEELLGTVVLPALKMLENDYLGGGGSRGNGQIEFNELEYDDGTKIDLNSIKL